MLLSTINAVIQHQPWPDLAPWRRIFLPLRGRGTRAGVSGHLTSRNRPIQSAELGVLSLVSCVMESARSIGFFRTCSPSVFVVAG